jgi:phosphomevalonate kinase
MVTSLVAGLFLHMVKSQPEDGPDDTELRLIHNVAQYAHSKAQGKVGSGFDVSSAVFGSQIYYRFATKCLQELLEMEDVSPCL